jgi:hypothetical protein
MIQIIISVKIASIKVFIEKNLLIVLILKSSSSDFLMTRLNQMIRNRRLLNTKTIFTVYKNFLKKFSPNIKINVKNKKGGIWNNKQKLLCRKLQGWKENLPNFRPKLPRFNRLKVNTFWSQKCKLIMPKIWNSNRKVPLIRKVISLNLNRVENFNKKTGEIIKKIRIRLQF